MRPPERLVRTFEWDGIPGHVAVEALTLEDFGGGRTKVIIIISLFHTTEDRDEMMRWMEDGLNQSFATLERLLSAGPKPR